MMKSLRVVLTVFLTCALAFSLRVAIADCSSTVVDVNSCGGQLKMIQNCTPIVKDDDSYVNSPRGCCDVCLGQFVTKIFWNCNATPGAECELQLWYSDFVEDCCFDF